MSGNQAADSRLDQAKVKASEPEVKKEEAEENFDDLTLFEMTKDESSISLQVPEPLNMSMDSDDFDKL